MKHSILFCMLLLLSACVKTQSILTETPETSTLATVLSPENSTPSLTENSPDQQTIINEVQALTTQWEETLLSSPGWVHLALHHYSTEDHGSLPNGQPILNDRLDESWYLLDYFGMVITSILTMNDLDGNPFQISVMQDGVARNLTLGEENTFDPYPLKLDNGFAQHAAQSPTLGSNLTRRQITLGDGRSAVQFTLHEGQPPSGQPKIEEEAMYDPASGALLGLALYKLDTSERTIIWQVIYLAAERVSLPPAEALAYLEQETPSFKPLPPQPTSTPGGVDTANSNLSFEWIGNDFDRPTFFYGDISAGFNYLGRVNFGGVPGGWCDRSPNGQLIAFNYAENDLENETAHEFLRWFSLEDVSTVHIPLPELELCSPVAWGPDNASLAFSAYEAELDCALYLHNITTEETIKLSSDAGSLWIPFWSPDGEYVAAVSTTTDPPIIYVFRIADSEVVYQGEFNTGTWRAPDDSPTLAWSCRDKSETSGIEKGEPL
ncbi:MAG: hypothetical protein ABIG63_15560 [Chloroflexota bacterium]